MSVSSANVLPFRRRDALSARESYLLEHEEVTQLTQTGALGRRIVRIKKTFFDGRERIEFALEREVADDAAMRAFVREVDRAVAAYFAG